MPPKTTTAAAAKVASNPKPAAPAATTTSTTATAKAPAAKTSAKKAVAAPTAAASAKKSPPPPATTATTTAQPAPPQPTPAPAPPAPPVPIRVGKNAIAALGTPKWREAIPRQRPTADEDEEEEQNASAEVVRPGTWPLLIDTNEIATVFFRHRGQVLIDAYAMDDIVPERLRRLALGALRYQNSLVIDVRDTSMLPLLAQNFDSIKPGLWSALTAGTPPSVEYARSLVKESDDAPYQGSDNWLPGCTGNFSLLVVMSSKTHCLPEYYTKFTVFEVQL